MIATLLHVVGDIWALIFLFICAVVAVLGIGSWLRDMRDVWRARRVARAVFTPPARHRISQQITEAPPDIDLDWDEAFARELEGGAA